MDYIIIFISGVLVGSGIVFLINYVIRKSHKQEIDTITQQMKDAYASLSVNALSICSGELLKLANQTLSGKNEENRKDLEIKKELIDQTLKGIDANLQKVEKVITDFEKDRAEKFGQIDKQLKNVTEQTGKLQDTAGKLQVALSGTRVRGQWGERMAEDVLKLVGFIEGINYKKQVMMEGATRPDYTFLLPQGLILNMDVKFPWDNYKKHYEAIAETDKEKYKADFLKDVKNQIKEVTGRDYINPAENTVDYALMFIPNEQVYRFIQESDSSILDDALKNKVVLCSPVTLYAILTIIRQAVDNFNLTKTAGHLLSLYSTFNKQWFEFCKSMEKMGGKIEDAHKEYDYLMSTRRKQLERPLKKIEDLRVEKGIPEAIDSESTLLEDTKESAT